MIGGRDINTYVKSRIEIDLGSLLEKVLGSPFYANKLKSKDSFSSIKDVPFTTKEELRETSKFDLLAVKKRRISHFHESSGTTGIPSVSWYTKEDLETGGQEIAESGIKLNDNDLVLIRFPFSLFVPAYLVLHAAYQTGAGVVPASSRNTVTPYPKVLELMRELEVTVFAGLPRELELLAETALQMSIDPQDAFPHLRGILVAGELLSPRRKAYLEKVWGRPIYNLYGSTETGNIAKMCEFGLLHLSEENYYVEVFEESLESEKSLGEIGVGVVTTLTNQGSPLIRYATGDLVSIHDSKCRCGSNHVEIRHYGRANDCLTIAGKTIGLYELQEAIYSLEHVPIAWKVRETDSGMDIALQFTETLSLSNDEIKEHLLNCNLPDGINLRIGEILFDTSALLDKEISRKPVYIEKNSFKGGTGI
ncbi:phenylacetate--CoA ligase family protein [Rossellomorea sp. LjRoot5]|uniref:phenylacetate--CoA ligase family protein n=1 Tax=Rossellomorea sp. LjRoot5 TaxID=3342331 RepID=UPI003ECD5C57